MKKLLLSALLFCLMNTFANAQCVPDAIYKDSTFGVYPKPYEPTINPKGGVNKSACIGKPFKFVFTAKIPDSTVVATPFGSLPAKIDSVILDKKDINTIVGLPVGMTYACNPPNCVFYPKKSACLYMYGTATNANKAGDYELKIKTVGYVNVAGLPFNAAISFPDKNIAPGTYILKLEPVTSTTCFVSGASDKYENISYISANPNPTNDLTKIAFYMEENDVLDFIVTDITGKRIHQETRKAEHGINTIDFDASNLNAGVYIYSLGNQKGRVTNRLVVNR
jgi:Secretion system C-terminal sorting domain